ncbi:hypothetical protein ACFQAT_15865 [Undibacterium arcticum]|uniref:hypothetical protein n=1 Tax=Undibacterium arcticum TaxID=1762892 RepID=UPI00360F6035
MDARQGIKAWWPGVLSADVHNCPRHGIEQGTTEAIKLFLIIVKPASDADPPPRQELSNPGQQAACRDTKAADARRRMMDIERIFEIVNTDRS